jgi:putative transposase
MTAPRQVIAGRTNILTRRCTQRQFLLRPDKRVEQLFLYCLAEAAQRFGVTLHGWIAMSNHEHVVARDNRGNFPEFVAHLNKMIAKALNSYWGRRENFWSSEQPSVVHLVQANDRFEKLIYTLVNPVAAHLVERAQDWPGATSLQQNLSGQSRTIKRPLGFFREDGPMPEEVTLRIERPEGFEDLTDEEWATRVMTAVRAAEQRAQAERRASNAVQRRVVGRKAVLRARHTDTARRVESGRELEPHLACRNSERRRLELAELVRFRKTYSDARHRWCAGDRAALFPAGTYKILTFGACCLPNPPALPLRKTQPRSSSSTLAS